MFQAEDGELARRVAELERRLAAAESDAASLRESELAYRELVELSPDAIHVHEEGRIVFVNPAAVKLYGARYAEDLIGLPLVRSLVEMHDGEFEIHSTPGAGTTVSVHFPADRLVA